MVYFNLIFKVANQDLNRRRIDDLLEQTKDSARKRKGK